MRAERILELASNGGLQTGLRLPLLDGTKYAAVNWSRSNDQHVPPSSTLTPRKSVLPSSVHPKARNCATAFVVQAHGASGTTRSSALASLAKKTTHPALS